jgi:DNA-binding XRE family transcriptional regulator
MNMPRKALPRIVSVAPAAADLTLTIKWNTGEETLVDVSGIINSFRLYAPLRQSPKLFRRARVGEHGADIVWADDLDMSNDTLWRLAREQSGATMTAEAFRRWRARRAYTLDAAARALGLSRRIIAYYEKGERPIPRVVALATRALEAAE